MAPSFATAVRTLPGFAGDVAILLGRGDGAFSLAGRFAAGYSPPQSPAGDFDGDGRADLAVASIPALPLRRGAVRPGSRRGLAAPWPWRRDIRPRPVLPRRSVPGRSDVADFDARCEGRSGRDRFPVGHGVAPFFLRIRPRGRHDPHGPGDGTLSPFPRSDRRDSRSPRPDFDADGKPDLAVTGGDLAVFAGRGDGTFGPPLHLHAGALPISVIAGDLDGDTREDLVVAKQRLERHLGPPRRWPRKVSPPRGVSGRRTFRARWLWSMSTATGGRTSSWAR